MILKQFYLNCLAQASYLIGDEETRIAAVIDPRRDVEVYFEEARFGSRWLWRRCFGGPQGQSQGHAVVPHWISDRSSRALGSGPEGRWFESSRHDHSKTGGYVFASITSVAFTTAVTASPSFRCTSSALRRVITASITCAPTLTVTCTRKHIAPLDFVDRPSQVIARIEN
jgi:hypothetical protein